ncbi:MAG: hypothetical protein KCHDKBKB_02209 [Elusimicrobia bacterium]|nr:hypothetical protein [Elusimicrobiota bacterium]
MIINKRSLTGLILNLSLLAVMAHATPSDIADLTATTGSNPGTVTLNWSAPNGGATRYIIKYAPSSSLISTESQFLSASHIEAPPINAQAPTPASGGSPETLTISGLQNGVVYSFSIKSEDSSLIRSNLSNGATAMAAVPCAANANDGKGSGAILPASIPKGQVVLTTVTFTVDPAGIGTGGKISLQVPDFFPFLSTATSNQESSGYISYTHTGGANLVVSSLSEQVITLKVDSGSMSSGDLVKFFIYAHICYTGNNSSLQFRLASQQGSCGILREIASQPVVSITNGGPAFIAFDPYEIVAKVDAITSFKVVSFDGCGYPVNLSQTTAFTLETYRYDSNSSNYIVDSNASLSLSSDMSSSNTNIGSDITSGQSERTAYYRITTASAKPNYIVLTYDDLTPPHNSISYIASIVPLTVGIASSSVDKGTLNQTQKTVTFDPGKNERVYFNFSLPENLSWKIMISSNGFSSFTYIIYGNGKNVRTSWDGYADPSPGEPPQIAPAGTYSIRIQIGPDIKDETCSVTLQSAGIQGTLVKAGTATALENVDIEFFGPTPRYTRSRTNGTFETGGLNSGSYKVRFFKPGYIFKEVNATVTSGNSTNLGTVELTEAAILRLYFSRSASGSLPDINGSVRAYNSDYSKQSFGSVRFRSGSTTSDAGDDWNSTPTPYTDLYLEQNVAYSVQVEIPGFAPLTFSNTLTSAGVTTSTPTLTTKPTIEGTVTIPAGGNAQGLWISVEAAIDANGDLSPDSTDPSNRLYGGSYLPPNETTGIYRVFGSTNAKYVLTAFAPGFVQRKINVTVNGSDVNNANFPIFSEGGNISGTITVNGDSTILDGDDNDGKFEIPINAYSPSTGRGSFAQIELNENASSTSGAYQLKGLEDGIYNVSVYQSGFGLVPPGPKSVTVSGGTGTLNLTLERFSGQFTGTLTLPTGQSNYGTVEVDALSFNHFGQGSLTGVISGNTYTISNLGTDFYTIRARYPTTGLVVTTQGQVKNGSTTTKNLDLSGATYSVSGRVTSSASAPYTLSFIVNRSTPTQAYTPSGPSTLNANRITAQRLRNRDFNDGGGGPSGGIFYDPKESFIGFYNANGDYSINGLAEGSYRLTTNGEMDGDLSNGNEISKLNKVLYVGQNMTGQNFNLTDGYKISGTIRVASGQSESGRSLNVQARDSEGSTVAQQFIYLSGTSAEFSLTHIPPGQYVVTVSDTYPRKYSSKDLQVEIISSDISNKEISLLNSGIIRGKLQVKKSGIVISAANYSQYLSESFRIEARSNPYIPGGFGRAENPIIDANGYFNIAVNPGTYDVVLGLDGGISDSDIAQGKKAFVNVTKSAISVSGGEIKDLGVIPLDEGIEMTGTVVDASGTPLSNIRVEAEKSNQSGHNDELLETFTDSNGKYVMRGIDSTGARYYHFFAAPRPDPFDQRFSGDTTASRYAESIKGPIDTQSVTEVNFTLSLANSGITATITTADSGVPQVPFGESGSLPGAIAILNKQPEIPVDNPLGNIEEFVSPSGTLDVKGLAAGVYDLYILAKGYGSYSKKNISVSEGETVDLGTIVLPTGYTLSGKLTKPNGDPVTTSDVEDIIAARNNFNEIAIAQLDQDASNNIIKYSISGIQPNKAYSIIGFGRSNSVSNLASDITLTSDTELDLTFEAPAPGVLNQIVKNNDGSFTLLFKFEETLRNSDIDISGTIGIKDDNEILSLTSGNSALGETTISSDRKEVSTTYTPAGGETSFTLRVTATFVSQDSETGANQTIDTTFTFYAGVSKQNSATVSNASGGEVDLSQANDSTSFTAPAGWQGEDEDSAPQVTLKAAATQSELETSASMVGSKLGALRVAEKLGLHAYPSEMAKAMSKLKKLDVSPLSSFYDIFLPAGVSHFFPEGKEARLCLSYDSSATDPYSLNVYYYNSTTDEYLLESENKSVDTVNEKICVSISHASIFTVLNSSVSIITGDGYSGELSIINFPNPFNLKSKTVTLQNPGSASASQVIDGTMIKLSVPTTISGTAEISIFDVTGALVRTIRHNVTGGSHYYLEWDGLNERGQKVASGTYIARLTVGGGNEKFFKMAVLK